METHAKIMPKVVSDPGWPPIRSWDMFWVRFWGLRSVWGLSLATFVDPAGVPGLPRRRPRTPQERHRDPQERPKTLLETLLGPSWVVWAPQGEIWESFALFGDRFRIDFASISVSIFGSSWHVISRSMLLMLLLLLLLVLQIHKQEDLATCKTAGKFCRIALMQY